MSVYTENSLSSVVSTKKEELKTLRLRSGQAYGSDRLGLVRRNLELGDQNACPFCPTGATIEPGMLRIVEVGYDSPLSNPSETHEGEFIVLRIENRGIRKVLDITIPLESVTLAYPGGLRTFSSGDKLGPYQWAVFPRCSTHVKADFANWYGLSGYATDHDVDWYWEDALTLPDPASRGRGAGGTIRLFDYTGGVTTILDPVSRGRGEVEFGGSGIMASNGSYCASSCSTAQTVQLDNFLTSPPGTFDAGDWSADNVSGYGQQGMAAFVLDNTHERELGRKEYELKDHLGNVRVVVSDIKHSDASSGTPVDFMADVLVMRDYYPFGMEIPLREDAVPGAVYQGDYWYGFNGMERDDEMKGEGMSYDFGARVYDPRVGRWWSCDPQWKKYVSISPMSAFGNSPIIMIDPGGETLRVSGATGEAYTNLENLLTPETRSLIMVTEDDQVVWATSLTFEQKLAYSQENAGFATVASMIDSKYIYEHRVGIEVSEITWDIAKEKPIYPPGWDRSKPLEGTTNQIDQDEPNFLKSFRHINWYNTNRNKVGQNSVGNSFASLAACGVMLLPGDSYLLDVYGKEYDYKLNLLFHEMTEGILQVEGMNPLLRAGGGDFGGLNPQALIQSDGVRLPYHDVYAPERDYVGAHVTAGAISYNLYFQKDGPSNRNYSYTPRGPAAANRKIPEK